MVRNNNNLLLTAGYVKNGTTYLEIISMKRKISRLDILKKR